MRKLPSSASAGNLRQLVNSSADVVIYGSNASSRLLAASASRLLAASASSNTSNIAMSELPMEAPATIMDTSNPPTPSETEDRGSKKSLAYRHTKFHVMLKDQFGKAYERRMCSHCDAVFSFKGGTTSAALRHLKTAHQESIVGNRLPLGATPGQQSAQEVQVAGNDDQSLGGGSDAEGQVALTSTSMSSLNVDVVESRNDNDIAVDAAASSGGESQRQSSMAGSSTASEDGYIRIKRKRGSDSDEEDDGENSGDIHNFGSSSKSSKSGGGSSSKLTASQVAIVHFLRHYAKELPLPAMRLRLAKHLTHNVGEAEMYNVLDPATQLEYVREFAQISPANQHSK